MPWSVTLALVFSAVVKRQVQDAFAAMAAVWVSVPMPETGPAAYLRSVQGVPVYVAPSVQVTATVSSLVAEHRLLIAGVIPALATGVWVQAPLASLKVAPTALPTLVKVTSVVCEPPGSSGVVVPPY